MKLNAIIKVITEDLNSRKLEQPSRRLSALANIDGIMKKHFNEITENPTLLKSIPKAELKSQIAKIEQVKKLNGAESSVINNIYDKLGQ